MLAALLTTLGVLAIGLAARSPETHEHVHEDASHPEHACAITLAATGYCDTSAPTPAIAPELCAPTPAPTAPESFAWTAPGFWLAPAQAPPAFAA